MDQTTNTILMIRPVAFRMNEQTAVNNYYQKVLDNTSPATVNAKAQKEFDKLNGMLSNERFVANAPANVIEENKKALDEVKGRLGKIGAELKSLA